MAGGWRTSMKARAALIGVTALGLGLYALVGGGSKSALPLQGKNVSTLAQDKYAVAATDTGSVINVAAAGPKHSVYYYWQVNGSWYGPLQIGAPGTAWSGPGIDSEATNGNIDVAVEGPNHSLLFFWQIGATWYGPLQIGAPGSTYSAPSIGVDGMNNVDVAAQGPNGTLFFYWSIGGAWNGPLQAAGPGTTLSAPSVNMDDTSSTCSSQACVGVAALGTNGQSKVYWEQGGTWEAPVTSGQNQEFSSPSFISSSGGWTDGYEGPSNSLIGQVSGTHGGTNTYCVLGGAGTTYSAPSTFNISAAFSTTSSGGFGINLGVTGPSNSLYVFWWTLPAAPSSCPPNYGPLQLSAAGTTFSVPAVDAAPDSTGHQVVNLFVQGPSNTLWVFWSSQGSWYGPLQIGGPATTFGSST